MGRPAPIRPGDGTVQPAGHGNQPPAPLGEEPAERRHKGCGYADHDRHNKNPAQHRRCGNRKGQGSKIGYCAGCSWMGTGIVY